MEIKETTGQQFFHIETYAKKISHNKSLNKSKRSSKRGRKSNKDIIKSLNDEKRNRLADKVSKQRTIKSILREVLRTKGFCDHVENPEPPIHLYGIDIPTLEITIEDVYKNAKTLITKKDGDLAARKIREDQQILLAGVASHPRRSEDYKSDPETKEMIDMWIQDTLEFLKKEYGDALKTVMLHTDEEHVHIHFYCMNEPHEFEIGNNRVLIQSPMDTIHPGKRAEKSATVQAEADGLKGRKKSQYIQNAFSLAMQAMQDRFYEVVSEKHGHQRLGPARDRYPTRAAYFAALEDQKTLENKKYIQRKAKFLNENKNYMLNTEIRKNEEQLKKLEEEKPKIIEKFKNEIEITEFFKIVVPITEF